MIITLHVASPLFFPARGVETMQTSLLRFVHKQQRDTTGKVCTPESRPAQKLQVKRSLVHSPDDSSGSDAKRTKVSGKGVCA